MLNQQHMADNLKFILSKLPTPDDRRQGLIEVKRLENAHWLPDEFERIVNDSLVFEINDGDLIFTGTKQKLAAARSLVDAYMAIVQPGQPAAQPDQLYSTKEACEYISDQLARRQVTLTPASVRRHLIENAEVPAQKLHARSLVYRQDDLDKFIETFAANPKGRGRPVGWRKHQTT